MISKRVSEQGSVHPVGKIMKFRRSRLLIVAICCLAIVLRIGALNQGLWVDEIFSLAMATGHSLEHPAARANPALGDFVELPQPVPPATYRRYMELSMEFIHARNERIAAQTATS